MVKDLTFIGRVSSINQSKRTAKVSRDDKEFITGDLIITNRGDNWLPEIGEFVLCIYLPKSKDGFIVAAF